MRLDNYGSYPSGMAEYLSTYGWHFSKKMCDWATGKMSKGKNIPFNQLDKEKVDSILLSNNVKLDKNKGYDYVYIANMCKADFYGSSINDEHKMAMFIKDYIDDYDAYEGMPFTRFYADCIGSGTPIIWEDML